MGISKGRTILLSTSSIHGHARTMEEIELGLSAVGSSIWTCENVKGNRVLATVTVRRAAERAGYSL